MFRRIMVLATLGIVVLGTLTMSDGSASAAVETTPPVAPNRNPSGWPSLVLTSSLIARFGCLDPMSGKMGARDANDPRGRR